MPFLWIGISYDDFSAFIKKIKESGRKKLDENGKRTDITEAGIEKMRQSILSRQNRMKSSNTKPELKMVSILEECSIAFEHPFRLENKVYDFRVGSCLLEVDGDYWHGNPEKYKILNEKQLSMKSNDSIKDEIANKNGFSIYRIWESDIYNNEEKLKEILNSIKQHI